MIHNACISTPPLLVLQDIAKSFGKKKVLSNLSLTISPGEVYGLVGLNGAGKTTLLRLVLGLLHGDSGTISFDGHLLSINRPPDYRHIGVVFESCGMYENLTLMENLGFFAKIRGMDKRALTVYIDEFWRGTDIMQEKRPVKYFSRGQKVQCGIARACLGNPKLVVMDEPAAALDFEATARLTRMVHALRAQGVAFLVSSHQLDLVADWCTAAGMLTGGAVKQIDLAHRSQEWRVRLLDLSPELLDRAASLVGGMGKEGSIVFSAPDDTTAAGKISQLIGSGYQVVEAVKGAAGRVVIESYFSGDPLNG